MDDIYQILIKIYLYTTSNKIHFDELCLEPSKDKQTTNKNIIFTMCADDQKQQNWIYNEQVWSIRYFFQSYFSFLDSSIRK